MATTGTYLFNPQLNELYDEVWELAGIDPATVGNTHLKAIARSMKFMLNSEWSTLGVRQWMIKNATQAMSIGLSNFALPAGAIDIIEAVLNRNGRETEMYPISRDDYRTLVDKAVQGRPDRYFVDRQTAARTVYLWQCGSNSTDFISFDYFHHMQDAIAPNAGLKTTLDMRQEGFNAASHGLAWRIAVKFNPGRANSLKELYGGPDYPNPERIGGFLRMMINEDRERSDFDLYPAYEPRNSRR